MTANSTATASTYIIRLGAFRLEQELSGASPATPTGEAIHDAARDFTGRLWDPYCILPNREALLQAGRHGRWTSSRRAGAAD